MIPIVAGLLMGAALGGGIAALQKKDVLQGALMGGVGGALGGAFMPAAGGLGGAAGAAEGAAAGTGLTSLGATEATAALANPSGMFAGGSLTNSATSGLGLNTAGSSALMPSALGTPASNALGTGISLPTTQLANTAAQPFSIGNFLTDNKYALAGGVIGGMMAPGEEPDNADEGNIRDYTFNREVNPLYGQPGQAYFNDRYTAGDVTSVNDYNKADGGIIGLADGGMPQDYRIEPFKPVALQDFSAARTVNPAVQTYNQQVMDRANQQYNINPRPAAMQVPGSAGYGAYTPLTVVSNKPVDAGIGGLRFDPVTGRYVGDFKAPSSSKEKTELERMQEEMDSMRGFMPNQDVGGAAEGGLMRYAIGGDIGMSYPSPDDGGVLDKSSMVGAHQTVNMAPHYPMQGLYQGYAGGGHLGDYSDGGRLLKGPGDGVSDDIPAQIGARQPARLADGEFVVPARVVSELGNGSTDAGAKRLYAMMDRVQSNRRKSVGKGRVAVDSKAYRNLPA